MKDENYDILKIPLANVDFRTDVRLDDNLVIRTISVDELEGLLKSSDRYNYKDVKERALAFVNKTKYVIEGKYQVTEDFWKWSWIKEIDRIIKTITLALRLLGIEHVWTPIAFTMGTSLNSVETYNLEFGFDRIPKGRHINNQIVCLDENQANSFEELWKELLEANKNKPYLKYALSRFNRSFEEDSQENKLIDYITAFESIVFGRIKNAPSPYGRVIGIAIGMLIGRNEKERIEIEQKLNVAYEIRNQVVHGHLHQKIGETDKGILGTIIFVEKCLKESLIKLLEE